MAFLIDPEAAAIGKVDSPGSSTDNALPRFDGTAGELLQDSGVLVDDSNNVTGIVGLTTTGNVVVGGQAASTHDAEVQAASGSHTIDFNNGNSTTWDLQNATGGGNVTLTLSNPLAGASYVIVIIQSSSAKNVIWPGNVKWVGGSPPTISTANDAEDVISLFYDGTSYYGTFTQGYS